MLCCYRYALQNATPFTARIKYKQRGEPPENTYSEQLYRLVTEEHRPHDASPGIEICGIARGAREPTIAQLSFMFVRHRAQNRMNTNSLCVCVRERELCAPAA